MTTEHGLLYPKDYAKTQGCIWNLLLFALENCGKTTADTVMLQRKFKRESALTKSFFVLFVLSARMVDRNAYRFG